ncbi:MAG: ethanolamine ammonia-lyase subunit EutC [Burkholderiaceae bacterium]|nr:ethanolamine ammonia-lyase subunit EutC [Burkholderiaceae bacterium]
MKNDAARPAIRPSPTTTPDPWSALRAATPARIALGRAGSSLPTRAMLEFQLAHARARDAVHRPLDVQALGNELALQGLKWIGVDSQASDRRVYLARPDLGRRLAPASRHALEAARDPDAREFDLVFVLADGLSSTALAHNALPLLLACLPAIHAWRWHVAPIVIARQARVALSDEIGDALGARLAVMLVGERPGLSAADSLGVYLTWMPRPGRTDAQRNCVSNIHANGLRTDEAAQRVSYLASEAARRRISGVALKDDSQQAALPGGQAPAPHSQAPVPARDDAVVSARLRERQGLVRP